MLDLCPSRARLSLQFSFLNCTKYPPSLLVLLMTLGPAIVALSVFDRIGARGPLGQAVVTFGRVPLFCSTAESRR